MSDHDEIDEQQPEAAEAESEVDDAAMLRALIVRAHPDAIPELIRGASLREMLDSLPDAQAAYARVAEAAAAQVKPPVPSGSAIRSREQNPANLSPAEKIRSAMNGRRR